MPADKKYFEETEVKRKLFGQAVKLPAGGGHVVDVVKATAPIAEDEGVIRLFCSGCGSYIALNRKGLVALAERAGIQYLPDSLIGCYFQAEQCLACGDGFVNIVFHA